MAADPNPNPQGQNGQNPPAQNQNPPAQNPPAQNGQNPQGQNGQNPQGQNGQNPGGQNQNPNSGSGSSSSTFSIPQTAPAGGIIFTQPAQTAAASFYKIAPSQLITFGWNMTSVLSQPQSLTLSALCDNGFTYPVGPSNGIIPGSQSSVVWDPVSYQSANPGTPLGVGSCTLSVWDDRGPTALPAPGLFGPNNQLRFALYTTQLYTPLASGWQCQGCNAASPNSVAHGFPVALTATCIILLLSGLGILRTALGIRVRD